MISDDDLRGLAKAAKAAARREGSGAWIDRKPDDELGRVMSTRGNTVADYAYPETRRFIAAACPDVVLELVAELLKRRGADDGLATRFRELADRGGHQTCPLDAAGEPDV